MSVPRAPTDKADVWKGEKFKGGETEGESKKKNQTKTGILLTTYVNSVVH